MVPSSHLESDNEECMAFFTKKFRTSLVKEWAQKSDIKCFEYLPINYDIIISEEI